MPLWATLRSVSSSEFTEWMAYDRIQPPEPDRSDWRVALSTAQIINYLAAALGAKGKVLQAKDLLLRFEEHSALPSQEELMVKMKAWGAMLQSRRKTPPKKIGRR